MIIAGSDVSGNEINGQHGHIAFVVGHEESINALHKEIGIKEIHMMRLDEVDKKQVIQNLDFEKYGIKAWCFHVGRQHTVDSIYEHVKLHPKNKRKDKIHQNFDYHLFNHFKPEVEKLTLNQSMELSDLRVQCDGDMIHSIKFWKMKEERRGKAYELSDAVARCNEHNRSLKGCVEMDLKDDIFSKMSYDLFR